MCMRVPFGLQGVAKRVPVSEFLEQAMGQQGVKAITLAVGDSLAAMHACPYSGGSVEFRLYRMCQHTLHGMSAC